MSKDKAILQKTFYPPKLTDWMNFPPSPTDLPAAATYALINDEFPLELHGDPTNDFCKAGRTVGHVSARRGVGGLVDFKIIYADADRERLVNEIFAAEEGNPPVFQVLGSGWPYKAVVGIFGFEVAPGRKQGSILPFKEGLLNTPQEKENVGKVRYFLSKVSKLKKQVYLNRYHELDGDGINVKLEFAISAHTLCDLDRVHLALIRHEGALLHATKRRKGQFAWVRNNRDLELVVTVTGNNAYILAFAETLGAK